MPLNVVIPSNLDSDFTIDVTKSKIYNHTIIIGTGAPTTNPPVEEKEWLWVRDDVSGGGGDYAISHVWVPSTATWETLGASIDFRLTGVSVNNSTGEITFTITDPVSGNDTTITQDLTDLVDLQETVTSLTESSPGRLAYVDEDGTSNDVDVSGLRDTGQSAQRVEVVGDTLEVTPNGTDTRVTITNTESTFAFTNGTGTNVMEYSGLNIGGTGAPGAGEVVTTADHWGSATVIDQGATIASTLQAGDSDFSAGGYIEVNRNSGTDGSQGTMSISSDGGATANITETVNSANSSITSINNGMNGNAYSTFDQIVIPDHMRSEISGKFITGSDASYSLSGDAYDSTDEASTRLNATNGATAGSSSVGLFVTPTDLNGSLQVVRDGTTIQTGFYAEDDLTTQTASSSAAISATEYAKTSQSYDGTTFESFIEATDGTTTRTVGVTQDSVEITAGTVAANTVGGINGDVLVRFGTGSEVRFAPIGTAIGAQLNVNTATPALELVVGGSTVDTVALVDVQDAFSVHQFYAIP